MFVVVVVSWKNERRFRVRAPKGRQVGVIFGREVRQRLRITFSLKSPQDPGVTPVRIQEGRKTAHLPHRHRRHTHTHTHTSLGFLQLLLIFRLLAPSGSRITS